MNKEKKIAVLNDKLRKKLVGGIINYTPIVKSRYDIKDIMAALQAFDFEKIDSKYNLNGENNFGFVEVRNEKYYFKIDYYDKNLMFESADASSNDTEICIRVMTIMHYSEF